MSKYDINKDFRCFAWFKPPLNRFVVWLARVFWWIVPKGKRLNSVKRTKITLQNPYDGGTFKAILFERKQKQLKNKKKNNNDKKEPCFIYFHGGAFVFDAIWYHFNIAQQYVLRANCKVFFVRYRLAPKYKRPCSENDCAFSIEYVVKNAEKLGIDAQRLAVGGDSAGGFLAMRATIRAVENNICKPKLLMLIYPVIDADVDNYSMREFTDTPVWNSVCNQKMWRLFAPDTVVDSPVNWRGFADIDFVYVETAEFDCLRDRALFFAKNVKNLGGNVLLNETKGTIHGYDGVTKSSVTQSSIDLRCEFIKRV